MNAVSKFFIRVAAPTSRGRRLPGAALPALLLLAGCTESATVPAGSDAANAPPGSDAVIGLDKTGGFAGVDFAYLVDGPGNEVRGGRCVHFCDWNEGDVLAKVSGEGVSALESLFDEADFLAGEDEDFGDECCDQFHYGLTFKRGDASRTVSGTSEKLPAAILALILEVEEFVETERAEEEDASGNAADDGNGQGS